MCIRDRSLALRKKLQRYGIYSGLRNIKYTQNLIQLSVGSGRETVRYGSNVIEILSQTGHTIVDLNYPVSFSTIIDQLRFKQSYQAYFAAISSGIFESFISTGFLCFTKLRSS
eukprot:TRINITY_DN16523_c0_g1_i2.p4 TRINITY_DN16523_c0_g1~~TRINITY_DN16523_c0_g1_i2.p4  ORF type:complete len:113 (+),score=0.76 TRINITY_DN16523_c0_g1_i2:110-448(+)